MRRRQRGLMRRIKAVLIKTHDQRSQVRYFRYSQISYAANPIDFAPIIEALHALREAERDASERGDPRAGRYHGCADWLRDTFELYEEENEK